MLVFDSCSIASQPTQPAACINSTFHCLFAHSLSSSSSSSIRTIRQWAIGNCHSLKGNYQTSATVKAAAAAAAAVDVVIFFTKTAKSRLIARALYFCALEASAAAVVAQLLVVVKQKRGKKVGRV